MVIETYEWRGTKIFYDTNREILKIESGDTVAVYSSNFFIKSEKDNKVVETAWDKPDKIVQIFGSGKSIHIYKNKINIDNHPGLPAYKSAFGRKFFISFYPGNKWQYILPIGNYLLVLDDENNTAHIVLNDTPLITIMSPKLLEDEKTINHIVQQLRKLSEQPYIENIYAYRGKKIEADAAFQI